LSPLRSRAGPRRRRRRRRRHSPSKRRIDQLWAIGRRPVRQAPAPAPADPAAAAVRGRGSRRRHRACRPLSPPLCVARRPAPPPPLHSAPSVVRPRRWRESYARARRGVRGPREGSPHRPGPAPPRPRAPPDSLSSVAHRGSFPVGYTPKRIPEKDFFFNLE
jgi:hypothetical protein